MTQMRVDPMQQAIDAATYARVLLLRDQAIEDVDDEMHNLAALADSEDLPEVFGAAVEMLAMLSSDELENLADLVRRQRHAPSGRRSRSSAPPRRGNAPHGHRTPTGSPSSGSSRTGRADMGTGTTRPMPRDVPSRTDARATPHS
jgi:hypothetical protein